MKHNIKLARKEKRRSKKIKPEKKDKRREDMNDEN